MNNLKAKLFGASAADSVSEEAWRVNFVDATALPDIKVIRTAFIVNYGLAIMALACIGYVVNQELSILDVANQIDKIEAQNADLSVQDKKARAASAMFMQYSAAVEDYVRFKTGGLDLFALYAQLGQLRCDDVVFENVLIDNNVVDAKKRMSTRITVSGRRKGVSKECFLRIESLYAKFVNMPYVRAIKGYEVKCPKSPTTVPDNQAQVVQFTFQLTLEAKS